MTDKQIIIDGVDVSGCECYTPNIEMDCILHPLQSDACKNNPNCYYKQLARKEQECKELKKQLERKEENYQKLLNKSNKYIHNLVDENVQDISNLARQLDQLKAEKEELKKILIEIKEIAEKVYNDCDNCYRDVDTNYDVDCIDCTLGGKAKLAKQILQKIREVENDNK